MSAFSPLVMRYLSPLRYPGGKARLWPVLDKIIRSADLANCKYVEPYAGGAGAGLALLARGRVASIGINDASRYIFAFWHSVTELTEEFCRLLRDTPLTIDEWQRQRELLRSPSDHSPLELGFAAFFLNRTNRSGIIESGGVIGGQRQDGKWKLDARFNRDELLKRVEWIGRHRDQIEVSGLDAVDFLSRQDCSEPTFAYLDPPYYHQARRLYERWYEPEDHAVVADVLRQLEYPWVVSYDDCPEIRELYREFESKSMRFQYTAARRYEGTEVMFLSPHFSGSVVNLDEAAL